MENGKEVEITYPEGLFEDVWSSFREALDSNGMFDCEDWCELEMKIGNVPFNGLDCKKVIGIRY